MNEVPRYDKPLPFFRFRYLFSGSTGKFSKRAFFYTMTYIIAVAYLGYALIYKCFDPQIATYIGSLWAAAGVNYYFNERGSRTDVQ